MSIKETKFSLQKSTIPVLQGRLKTLLDDNYLRDLPTDLREQLQDFLTALPEYQLQKDKNKYTKLKGEVLGEKDIHKVIIEATGYKKWSLEETENLSKKEIDEIKDQFGISFTENNINTYRYFLNRTSRSDINMIAITALPGYYYVYMDTNKSDIVVDDLLTLEEMKAEIESYF